MRRALLPVLCSLLAAGPALADDTPSRTDLLTFAQGALPVSVTFGPSDLRTTREHAIAVIDGNPKGFGATPKPGGSTETLDMVFSLPAATVFDRFAVPNVLETRSPSQTFFGRVEIAGSSDGPDGPFVPLAEADLAPHAERDQVTELTLTASELPAVSWVMVRLSGGLSIETEKTFFEFSEIIGNGTQVAMPVSDRFTGVWDGRGVKMELQQDGVTVTGCYDGRSMLSGTVDGSILRALGADDAGIPSQFILAVGDDGELQGLRSTNGAPFKPYDGTPGTAQPVCLAPEPPKLSCGSIIHGIGFDFDSATLRPDAGPILTQLHAGLAREAAARIEIIGHSSSEGAADYNRDLSQRRAQSVVDALVSLGLDPARMAAGGMGEEQPIASNDDEAGRSLNRRVEVRCTG